MTVRRGKYTALRLLCERKHEHLMSPEQAQRLEGEPCCWCGTPTYIATLQLGVGSERAQSLGRPRTRACTTLSFKAVACMSVRQLAHCAVALERQQDDTRDAVLERLFYLHRARRVWRERRAAA